MIIVLSLSPAIDITYRVPELTLGESHRVSPGVKKPGGKGINVARVLTQLGDQVRAVVPLGGDPGLWISHQLAELNIPLSAVDITADTRTCVTVVSGPDGNEVATPLNESAPTLSDVEWLALRAEALHHLPHARVCVLSGSIPADIPPENLGTLLTALGQTCPVVADTQGEHLLAAATAGVFLLTPNSREAQEATHTESDTEAAQALLALGAQNVFITQGADGGLFTNPEATHQVTGPILSGNPTGAGDALTAGVASALSAGTDMVGALRYGMAVAHSSLSSPWAGDIEVSTIDDHLSQIQVTR